ncbi:MAG: hypothetical protein AB4041_09905 [Microcystaceae cyanobacterium]
MKTATFLTSSCRYCRYFHTEGRRGGTCQQLGVSVESDWKACVLANHAFKTPWEHCETVAQLEKSFSLTTPKSTKEDSIEEPISA